MGLLSRFRARAVDKHSEESFRSLVQSVSDVITVFGDDGRVRFQSPTVERVLGYTSDQFYTGDPWFHAHPGDVARIQRYLGRCALTSGVHPPIEIRVRRQDGAWRYLEAVATNMLDDPGVRGIVVTTRDISERKHLEDSLTQQAFYDRVTGLANRNRFVSRLTDLFAASDEKLHAVLFLDLDGFKAVNDTYGHEAGDRLLALVGQRLARCIRPTDLAARFGGDEFTVLLEGLDHPVTALRTGERIIAEVRKPFSLDGNPVQVGVSVGVALHEPGAPVQPEHMLRDADAALYAAKARGKGRVVLFDPSMKLEQAGRITLEADLRGALDRQELRLHYQPEVRLDTGEVVGVEALLRWEHPQRGLLRPADFIPVAEESGLIVPLGRWALEQACQQAVRWQSLRPDGVPFTVSVNLSARQLLESSLPATVGAVVRDAGLHPSRLRLEVAETSMAGAGGRAESAIDALRDLGVGVTLDNFGTGATSLNVLRTFKSGNVKLSRTFVNGLDADGDGAAMVRSVAGFAHALKMHVTIEGVETAAELGHARGLDADAAQGYYLSEPLPPEAASWVVAANTPIIRRVA